MERRSRGSREMLRRRQERDGMACSIDSGRMAMFREAAAVTSRAGGAVAERRHRAYMVRAGIERRWQHL